MLSQGIFVGEHFAAVGLWRLQLTSLVCRKWDEYGSWSLVEKEGKGRGEGKRREEEKGRGGKRRRDEEKGRGKGKRRMEPGSLSQGLTILAIDGVDHQISVSNARIPVTVTSRIPGKPV